jgi:hypothetical protein
MVNREIKVVACGARIAELDEIDFLKYIKVFGANP